MFISVARRADRGAAVPITTTDVRHRVNKPIRLTQSDVVRALTKRCLTSQNQKQINIDAIHTIEKETEDFYLTRTVALVSFGCRYPIL